MSLLYLDHGTIPISMYYRHLWRLSCYWAPPHTSRRRTTPGHLCSFFIQLRTPIAVSWRSTPKDEHVLLPKTRYDVHITPSRRMFYLLSCYYQDIRQMKAKGAQEQTHHIEETAVNVVMNIWWTIQRRSQTNRRKYIYKKLFLLTHNSRNFPSVML